MRETYGRLELYALVALTLAVLVLATALGLVSLGRDGSSEVTEPSPQRCFQTGDEVTCVVLSP